jgi:cellulose biosynthesis protein BcsQ
MRTIAFFNNKGGVGKTTLVYHLAWMYSKLGFRVLAADLDPQANATSMFLPEEALETLFSGESKPRTVMQALRPLLDGMGDVAEIHPFGVSDGLWVLPGDLALSAAEDELSSNWPDCLDGKPRAFRVISSFWRSLEGCAKSVDADLVLMDVGPNLGALNRAALISAENIVIPLAPDIYSLQGLSNLGPALRRWRSEWQARLDRANPQWEISLPTGRMAPSGYVVLQHAVRPDRPVKAYLKWMDRIPSAYRESVLGQSRASIRVDDDPHCLATLKNYRSLMPMAQEARKPMFLLTAADGALGGHAQAVSDCYSDFRTLARTIEKQTRPSPAEA